MLPVGFLGQSFRQISIFFLSFMHQGHMGFIAISESAHFGMKNNFCFSQKYFASLGIARQIMEKHGETGFGPFFRPYWGPDPSKKVF